MNKNNKPLKGGNELGPVSLPHGSSREFDKALTYGSTEFNKTLTDGSKNLNKVSTSVIDNLNKVSTSATDNLNKVSASVTKGALATGTSVTDNLNKVSASVTKGALATVTSAPGTSTSVTGANAPVTNTSAPGTSDPVTDASAPVTDASTSVTDASTSVTDASTSVTDANVTNANTVVTDAIVTNTDASDPVTDANDPGNYNELVAKREKEIGKDVAEADRIQKASEAEQSNNPTGFMTAWLAPFVFWSKMYLSQAKAVHAVVSPIAKDAANLAASTTAELTSLKEIASFNADSKVKDQAFEDHLNVYYTENPGIERLDPGSLKWKQAKQKYEDELKEFTEKGDEEKGKKGDEEVDTKKGDTKEGKKGWFGGNSRKTFTLGQIQKGGRQSANRTKKSIHDFFKSSVTSSHILKMVKKHGDNKRNTKVKRKRVGKRSRKGRQ